MLKKKISESVSQNNAANKILRITKKINYVIVLKMLNLDFADGTVVKNLPAKAGDTGSRPAPGRSHVPRSPCATTTEPAL